MCGETVVKIVKFEQIYNPALVLFASVFLNYPHQLKRELIAGIFRSAINANAIAIANGKLFNPLAAEPKLYEVIPSDTYLLSVIVQQNSTIPL